MTKVATKKQEEKGSCDRGSERNEEGEEEVPEEEAAPNEEAVTEGRSAIREGTTKYQHQKACK